MLTGSGTSGPRVLGDTNADVGPNRICWAN